MAKSTEHRDLFSKIRQQLDDGKGTSRTIEDILTRVRSLIEVANPRGLDGMSFQDLTKLDASLCKQITAVMKQRLPSKSTPYHQLASWISSVRRTHAVEVFTSNYDLLMEQAFEDLNVPYFDGFSGSDRTFFDPSSMEQDGLPSRWARLWKVHGSINWWRTKGDVDGKNEVLQRRESGDTDDCQMIHPSHLKFDQSRIMPYLAMQDRLRSFLSRGQAVLVTCGYSFADWHLNQAILQGLSGNPTAVCFGLLFTDRASAVASIAKVGHRGNLRLMAVDGAVLGTIDQNWHSEPDPDNDFHGSAVCTGSVGTYRSIAEDDRCKFLLGDFKAFGEFLADQLAIRGDDRGGADAS